MNWEHLNLYLLYVLDTGNLRILGRLREINPKYQPNHQPRVTLQMDSLSKELSTIEKSLPSTSSRVQSPLKALANVLQTASQMDPNVCKLCKYVAKNTKGLNIHIRKAHGTLDNNKNKAIGEDSDINQNDANLCLGCKKTFSSKSGLTRHTKTCQPDTVSQNDFKCSTCDSSYKKSLTRHMKTCSGKQKDTE